VEIKLRAKYLRTNAGQSYKSAAAGGGTGKKPHTTPAGLAKDRAVSKAGFRPRVRVLHANGKVRMHDA
jgi:hypothetical protein